MAAMRARQRTSPRAAPTAQVTPMAQVARMTQVARTARTARRTPTRRAGHTVENVRQSRTVPHAVRRPCAAPMRCAHCRAIHSPRPAPGASWSARENAANTAFSMPAGTPGPVSATSRVKYPAHGRRGFRVAIRAAPSLSRAPCAPAHAAAIATPPQAVYFSALSISTRKICRKRAASPCSMTGTSSAMEHVRSRCFARAFAANQPTSSSRQARTSKGASRSGSCTTSPCPSSSTSSTAEATASSILRIATTRWRIGTWPPSGAQRSLTSAKPRRVRRPPPSPAWAPASSPPPPRPVSRAAASSRSACAQSASRCPCSTCSGARSSCTSASRKVAISIGAVPCAALGASPMPSAMAPRPFPEPAVSCSPRPAPALSRKDLKLSRVIASLTPRHDSCASAS